MIHLLYHRTSFPTGHVIADALGVEHGTGNVISPATDVLIRWGSRAEVARGYAQRRTVNPSVAIRLASDKFRSLEVMSDAGVSVPAWSRDPEDLKLPILGRRTHHARGTDITLCLQRGDWIRQPRDYYVEYIPTVREFRIHVAFGRVIRVQGKYLDQRELAVPWVRNFAHGYRFRSPRKKLNTARLEAAVQAVDALGLDFGAVDLIIGDDEKHYVLEVNTAPSCSPLTAASYVTAFKNALNIPEEQVALTRLDILSPNQEDNDTEDEVDEPESETNSSWEGAELDD